MTTSTTSAPPSNATKKPKIRAPRVFWPAAIIIGLAVLLTAVFPAGADTVLQTLQSGVVSGFAPYFVLLGTGFVIFCLAMGLSRFGDIKLGKDEDKPEFGLLSWFAMLFAAGMGIGLVFFGASEPFTFFVAPKPGVDGGRAELAEAAMSQTFLHWGLHAWAIYGVVGMAVAYAVHRKGREVSIRWALEPLLGDKVRGWLGHIIDIIAVVGTLFGIATSLGLGVEQISAGLEHLGVVGEVSDALKVILIVVITLIATASVVSGVGKGIRWLSNTNLGLAGVFLLALVILGPTLYLFRDVVQSTGAYLQHILELTFHSSTYTGEDGQAWQGRWTIFYWGWWISWAPFVGVFIARISRGRTVRQFVAGVMLVPTLVTIIWFTVLGGGAINQAWEDFNGGLFDPAEVNEYGEPVAENVLFNYLTDLPLGALFVVIAMTLVAIFFVTSSDSGSLVVDMLASGGEIDPPKWSRVMWAFLEGGVAIALLLAGGLGALQTGAILTAVPVSVVMILMCISIYRAFSAEHNVLVRIERRQRQEELARHIGEDLTSDFSEHFDEHFGEHVDERIGAAFHRPINWWRTWRRRQRSALSEQPGAQQVEEPTATFAAIEDAVAAGPDGEQPEEEGGATPAQQPPSDEEQQPPGPSTSRD